MYNHSPYFPTGPAVISARAMLALTDSKAKWNSKAFIHYPQDKDVASEIRVYPNPTSGRIQLDLPNIHEGGSIVLYTLDGRIIFNKNIIKDSGSIAIQLNNLTTGVYVYCITLKNQTPARGRLIFNESK
jgi:hypothetical protein